MWRFGLAVVASCGFRADVPSSTPTDTAPVPGRIDASPDARVLPACTVDLGTPVTDRGRVGGNGGGDSDPLACASGSDRIVGIAVRMSNDVTLYGMRSAHGLALACAPVVLDPNTGTGTTGTVTVVEAAGNGEEDWSPSTLTPIAMCPAGLVVDGLQARTGPSNNLFKEVRFRCAQLDGTTAQTVSNQTIYVAGSLTEGQGVDTVNCNANELVAAFATRRGSGFDSANVRCAPARCL